MDSVSFFLLLAFISTTVSHWMCDLAKITCPTDAIMCSRPLNDSWVKSPSSATVFEHLHSTSCANLCSRMNNCSAFLHLPEVCVIAQDEEESSPLSKLECRRNVAFGKPTYAAPDHSGLYISSFAVDGKVSDDHDFYHSNLTIPDPWLLVDLSQQFLIKTIRIISRNDNSFRDRFVSVMVLVGNSLSTDGDFSSYELVTVIAGPNPGVFYWYIVKPELDRPYRYVALKRITPIGASYILEVNEIEVLI